ncbi:MAG TPA: hypothetical protein PKA13_07330 [Geminicoccaceae bacterium]|nr:hypothetical protein [Geminicoccus sp.]HMU49570.1 hypothetical protein [Geminicoccaceae bacterium]
MPSLVDTKRALHGAWAIARRDPGAMSRFDLTVEGFWGSFFAAVVAAPGYLLLLVDQYAVQGLGANLGEVALVELLAYAAGWIAFPLLALPITQALGLGHRYVPLVVASNWGSVLQVALLVAFTVLATVLPEAMHVSLRLAVMLVALAYQWQVVRVSLETTGLIAAGLVIVDILVAVIIQRGAGALIQPADAILQPGAEPIV